ncbi:MAG: hypothetical protein J5871_06905, partial [Bacteroidales bacterium]|nr:hypothetical protein [Bacteroidales bacterium]
MRRLLPYLLFLTLLPVSLPGAAQALPVLETAPEIVTGTLPGGISYYMVADKSIPGHADFALVWKGCRDTDAARKALDALPHFRTRAPYRYLGDNGISYTRRGYISRTASSTIFRFQHAGLTRQAVCDSTLLVLFDLAGAFPGSQTMVVCGDIDVPATLERMKMLAFLVPPRAEERPADTYSWQPSDTLVLRTLSGVRTAAASMTATYRLPRPDAARMKTLQPLVTKAFLLSFGQILDARIKTACTQRGVPLAQTRFRYVAADETEGDEWLSYTLYTTPERLADATGILAGTLSALNAAGADSTEVKWAKDVSAATALESRSYLERCIAACLYDAHLIPARTAADLYRGKRLPDAQEARLFNNFIRAFLDEQKDLRLTLSFPEGVSGDARPYAALFGKAWKEAVPPTETPAYAQRDTLPLSVSPRKVRLKNSEPEPVSGGEMWTFSNGMKVIYKHTPGSGTFRYALMIRGGAADIPRLEAGENAFVNDMGGLLQVAGMSGADFSSLLAANGICWKQEISLSDFRISGEAPSRQLSLLLKALLAFADKRETDAGAFAAYREGEALRIRMHAMETEGIKALVDSLSRPAHPYRTHKAIGHLGQQLPDKVQAYLDRQFAHLGNGLLVLAGDLDRNAALQHLCRYLGGFRTGTSRTVRPLVSEMPAPCWQTVTVPSARTRVGEREKSANVSLSCTWPVSAEHAMLLQLSRIVLERELCRRLAPIGAFAEVEAQMEQFPAERFSLFVSAKPVLPAGLPAAVRPASSAQALEAIRQSTEYLRAGRLTDEEFCQCRTLLEKQAEGWLAKPENL